MLHIKPTFTAATIITLTRLACAPFLAIALAFQQWEIAFCLVLYAMFSDWADGFVARTFNQTSELGALLDTVADKSIIFALTITTLINESPILPNWFVWLVLIKEACIALGAIYLYGQHTIVRIAPLIIGKISMALQMGLFAWALAHLACDIPFWTPSILITASFLLLSAGTYAYNFLPQLLRK